MKKSILSISAIIALSSTTLLGADTVKRTLKGNMSEVYKVLPGESTNGFLGMFSEGEYYARLRSNTFKWDWKDSDTKDHLISGLGGSLIYKTASLSGFSMGAGAYYSYAISKLDLSKDSKNLANLKAGKDTLSRYNNINGNGESGLFVPAQYYLEYKISKTNIKAGQQLWESLFTKSNDTKMIPNSFMGVTMTNKDIPKTTLRTAWFYSQKLRDHTTNHDLITFKTDDDSTTNYKWKNNDDSAVNKSLTYSNFKVASIRT